MSRSGRQRRTRLARVLLAGLVAGAQLGYGVPRAVEARVDPLRVIKRQIKNINMLVVLDTSGSMTGVPGGDFTSATEAGIDCDYGVNCRGWGTPGGCPPDPPQCQPVAGSGCPDGMMPDLSSSGNLVKNHDFSTGGGSGPTWDAAAGFTAGVNNGGDNSYPSEVKCAVQKNGATVKQSCSNSRKNSLPDDGCYVQQAPFAGDSCLDIAATTGYLLCNGDGSAFKAWEQTVSGLSADTDYVVWAHVSHANHPQRASSNQTSVASSTWQFKLDGSSIGTAATVPPEGDRSDAWAKQDAWVRVQSSFKTGAAQTSATLALWDDGTGADGDEAAITQIHVRKCVPITGGLCSYTKEPCDTSKPCPAIATCSLGEKPCSNPGGACEAVGHCQDTTDPPIFCTDELDCPQWGDKGKCAATGDPCNGPCASAKKCSVTGETCDTTTPCPQNKTKGYCASNPTKACSSDKQCKDSSCIFPGNACGGQDNFCKHPHRPCHKPDEAKWGPNTCIQRTNKCEIPPPAKPVCEQPSANKIMMCQSGGTVCTKDADCEKGDVCGPPTSRAVIAKRSLRQVIQETAGAVNYGFMTFWQDGYFPYFTGAKVGGGGIKTTKYYPRDELIAAGCYDGAVLKSSCNLGTLRAASGARYYVPYADRPTDQDFCGDVCAVKPGYRSGTFVGAYYETTATSYNGGNGGRYEHTAFEGRTWNNMVYYTPNPRFYNGGETPAQAGFQFVDCQTTKQCGLKCGASFDPDLVNFLDDTGKKNPENVGKILKRLELAENGGAVVYEATPSGCALENPAASAATDPERISAYHYMDQVLTNIQANNPGMSAEEAQICRTNYVLFITDGAANGPGDLKTPAGPFQAAESACLEAACSADDPEAAGCQCRAVLAAWHMRQKLKVKTLVVGFGGDVTQGTGFTINNNIAKAGGTEAAFTATRESELVDALRAAIYKAAAGSYTTSQSSTSVGTQGAAGVTLGSYVLDTRVDFPSWKGHLIAYDVSSGTPEIVWDAATELDKAEWSTRRVYVGSSTGPKQIVIEGGAVKDAATFAGLFNEALGIGAGDPRAVTATEADQILRWLLGDPVMKNPARLGAIINSTPIDVGGFGLHTGIDGAETFYAKYKDRASLTYVGTSHGMLHAFFSRDTTLGDGLHPAGSEAFAFVPQEMLPRIRRLFAQGGQLADPDKHTFGLANSPKVKDLCVKGCTKDDGVDPDWRTLLVMPEGFEGKLGAGEPHSNALFVLDITEPIVGGTIVGPKMWWSSRSVDKDKYDKALGETISLAAFAFNKTDAMDDNWLVMTSGYGVKDSEPKQGRKVVVSQLNDTASSVKGTLRYEADIPSDGDCTQELTNLTDVATARDFAKERQKTLFGGYFGDTWGSLWRWPGSAKDKVDRVLKLDCKQPLHFSPAILQLDRDNPDASKGEIWIVQPTNSALDEVTERFAERSRLVIAKEKADASGTVNDDPSFNKGNGPISISTEAICTATDGAGSCTAYLPASARPAGTPVVIPYDDAAGFVVVTLWYVPPTFGCGQGTTYFSKHDVGKDSTVTQTGGAEVAKEAVVGIVVAAGKLWVASRQGAIDLGKIADIKVKPIPPQSSVKLFRRSSWVEIF
jgi:hypothetical protein